MLRASISFFVLGLVALALGANNVAGVSLELGRLLLFVFLGLAILTFLGGLVTGRGTRTPHLMLGAAFTLSLLGHAMPGGARADEGIKQNVENTADDAKKETNKTVRKSKKSARKAWGTDTAAKDAGDKAADLKDDATAEANKAKRKANSD